MNPTHIVPFAFSNGLLVADVTVDGHPARFLIDSGSGLSSLDTTFAARLGLTATTDPLIQVRGTGDVGTQLATVGSLRAGSVELRDARVLLLPLVGISEVSGFTIDGILGFDFLSPWVAQFDFAARTLALHDPATWQPGGEAGIELPVSLTTRIPVVDAIVSPRPGVELPARLAVDLGSARIAARLLGRFCNEHAAALADVRGIESPIGRGVGGLLGGRITRFHSIRLGSLVVAAPTVGLTTDLTGVSALGYFDGTLGTPVLARTRLTIDYARSRIFLAPTADLDAPFRFDQSGVLFDRPAAHDALRVTGTVPASPAAEAGLRDGDEIVAIDGVAVAPLEFDTIRLALARPGSRPRLAVRRGGTLSEVALELRELV